MESVYTSSEPDKLQSSIMWLCSTVLDMNDIDLLNYVRDKDMSLKDLSSADQRKVDVMRELYLKLGDYERFTSCFQLIIFAGMDECVYKQETSVKMHECIQRVKDGLHYYAMSMGDFTTYGQWCKKSCCLPWRHLHTCLTRVWV